tara:strand:- start:190 stop:627 length:438 start_codon:yes stop_codon:yes gene_type:complete
MSWEDILKAPLNPREREEAQEFAGEEIAEENKKLKDNYKEWEKLKSKLSYHWGRRGFYNLNDYDDWFKPNDPEFKLFKEFLDMEKYSPKIEGLDYGVYSSNFQEGLVADIERAKELYEELLKITFPEKRHTRYEYPSEDEEFEGI